ncbi:hypothetical protein OG21DRAFT_1508195 [Imleria badia]|nr:hypothetical protein OG21DRAFT_1508195 [Imleria badia]
MRFSSSLVSVALYLSLTAAAAISNAGDIASRDDGGSGNVFNSVSGAAGEIAGVTVAKTAPPSFTKGGIKGATDGLSSS